MTRPLVLFICLVTLASLTRLAMCREPSEPVIAAMLVRGEENQTLPRPNWELKYKSGSLQAKKGTWLKGAFLTGQGEEEKTSPIVAVRRDEVRAIYFNSTAQRQSQVLQRMPRSGCYQAHYLMPKDESAPGPRVFGVWAASPGRMTRTAERLSARYPVRLVWDDNETEKDLVFTLDQCEYASFMANLRWFAGDRWKTVSREFPK